MPVGRYASVPLFEITIRASSAPVTFRVVAGRRYAAFIVPDPLTLAKLTWYDAAGRVMASTTAVPRFGYTQFQP